MNRMPDLRRVSREALAYRNLLAQRRVPVAFEWLDTDWEARWMPPAPVRDGLFDVQADWGGARIVLRVDAAWLDQVAQQVVGAPLAAAVPASLAVALVECALADLAAQLEMATRKRLRIVGVGEPVSREGLHGMSWTLSTEELQTCGELWADAIGLGFIADACRGLPREPDEEADDELSRIPIPVRLAVGWTDIDARRLAALRRRDVVLLDECWLHDGTQLVLRVGDTLGLHCTAGHTTLEITEGFKRIMSDTLEPLDGDDDDVADSFDELPVRLSFDLGERALTLAELRSLMPGYTFDLGRELRRAVIVRANGRAVGEGELVEIDGRIGVSILALKGAAS